MDTYTRTMARNVPNNPAQKSDEKQDQAGVKIDGFDQVLSMLKIADPAFRDSLLRRLAARDPKLAANLAAELKKGR